MTRIAAFLFDMDGLLLDTERLFMKSLITLTDKHGIDPAKAEAFYLDLIGTSAAETSRQLKRFLPAHIDPLDFENAWRQEYDHVVGQGVPLRPRILETLEALKAKGARMAVVTSTYGQSARAKLKKAGIYGYFEVVKAGDEVSANKPNPAPYLEAAAALGVSAEDCVAFEDSDTGTTAAVAAGCLTFQIPDLRPVGQSLPKLGQCIAQDLGSAVGQLPDFDAALTTSA
ncbi:MAG: HAD family phosphatase [Cognatishimia sp.]|uniref:HAD family hydrolase n=1 Tax=Cognatishimia sp. TaxID=2211648 RepID=UPI003B8B7FC7